MAQRTEAERSRIAERVRALVDEWQGPVYAWALRMLGDAAEAEDAAQETFLRAFERWDRFDESREVGPWIYRVATRVVLNRVRSERVRKKARDRLAASPPARTPTRAVEEDLVERAEGQRVVEEHVRRLPDDERAAVLLHFYAGLPQAEVARALGEPRSTVQARVARALDSLRGSLRSAGYAGLVPTLDSVMRTTPLPPVPPGLAPVLASTAVSSATAASAALVIGGIVVTQKLVLAALAVSVVLAGAGFATGRATAPDAGDPARAEAVSRDLAVAVAERDRLREELDRRAAQALATADRPAAAETTPSGAGAPSDAAAPGAATPSGASPAGAVDWSRFAKLLAEAVDLIDASRDADEPVDPETQRRLMAILVEYQRAATEARALSTTPFFDDRVLPGLVEAALAVPLDLPQEARASLDARVREALASSRSDVAAAAGRPVATYAVRARLVDDILETARRATPESARERFVKVERIARGLLGGPREVDRTSVAPADVEFPFPPDGTAPLPVRRGADDVERRFADAVLGRWSGALGLDDRQVDAARPVAQAFARAALDAWRRHGVDAQSPPDRVAAAERDVLPAQVDAERALDAILTPEQRKKVAANPPTLFVPTAAQADSSESTFGDGI